MSIIVLNEDDKRLEPRPPSADVLADLHYIAQLVTFGQVPRRRAGPHGKGLQNWQAEIR